MLDGVININKPENLTSADVVYKIKKLIYNLGYKKKVGHTGTLDPMATGVLPVCIGEATKISQYILADKKRYSAEILFGVTTDTLDITGQILSQKKFIFNQKKILDTLDKFKGKYYQEPPMYSAIKYNGKKLYELARDGINIKRYKRLIEIFSLEFIDFLSPNKILVDITCSKGTYIRSLCHDIGQEIGCGACLSKLQRTECGKFVIDKSISLDELDNIKKDDLNKKIISIENSLSDLKKICVSEQANKFLYNGNKIDLKFCEIIDDNLSEDEKVFTYDFEKNLIGIYKKQSNFLIPLRLFVGDR